jgi:hypothetical protein
MPELSASFRFSWEPASWRQSLKALFITPPPNSTWFKDLETFDVISFTQKREEGSPRCTSDIPADQSLEDSCNILHKTVAYLAKYPNPRLEGILVNKIREISSADSLRNAFHSVLLLSLRVNRPKILEVCQKVVSLQQLTTLFKVKDVMSLVQTDAIVAQKPEHRLASLSKSLAHALQQPLQKTGKIFLYIFSTTCQAYAFDFDNPPKNSQRAQAIWNFYYENIRVIFPAVLTFIVTWWKTSLVVGAVLSTGIAATYHWSLLPSSPRKTGLFHGDDIQQCHSPSEGRYKREPSTDLTSCFQALEKRRDELIEEQAKAIQEGNELRTNPDWGSTDKGIKIVSEIGRIKTDLELLAAHLAKVKKLSLRVEKLSQLRLYYGQKENALIHLINEQKIDIKLPEKTPNKNIEEAQKIYLFLKYLFLPETRRECNAIVTKCKFILAPPPSPLGSRACAKSASLSALTLSPAASPSAPHPHVESFTLPPPAVTAASSSRRALRQSSDAS